MSDQIINDSGNRQEAGSLHRVVSCRVTSCNIVAAVEREESKLPDMRWKKLENGDFVLQIRQAEINGFDEDGVPHFSGRGWWADVPIWDEKAANDGSQRRSPAADVENTEPRTGERSLH